MWKAFPDKRQQEPLLKRKFCLKGFLSLKGESRDSLGAGWPVLSCLALDCSNPRHRLVTDTGVRVIHSKGSTFQMGTGQSLCWQPDGGRA